MEQQDDTFIINRVLTGRTDLYAGLVDRYKDRVYSLAMSLLKQRELAEEVSQDVFVKAFKGLSKFRGKSKFSTWLFRIVYNECISLLRKRKNREVYFEESPLMEPSHDAFKDAGEIMENELRTEMLAKALSQLETTDRALVSLYYYENRSVEEVAAVVSLSSSNVKTRLFRIRKKLYDIMVSSGINVLANS